MCLISSLFGVYLMQIHKLKIKNMISSIPTLTEMIINSLESDYDKLLRDRLNEKNLEYILNILLEKCDFTIDELLTFNDKNKIEKLIEEEIDENNDILIKIKTKDKNRFANILMNIKQCIKSQTESDQSLSDISPIISLVSFSYFLNIRFQTNLVCIPSQFLSLCQYTKSR